MDNVKFTIVIPTRNRSETLKYCLMTCINQNYDNYEIIVSDNCSSDNTKEVVESLNCNKIRYYKTKEVLPMTKNYQFALEKVKGEYVIYLGDDDGLHFHALDLLNEVINLVRVPVINWRLDHYEWPGYLLRNFENLIKISNISSSVKSGFFSGKEKIKKVLKFEEKFNVLPMLYMNSAIKMDFIKQIQKKNVGIFDSCEPDVYSGLVTAYYVKEYFYLNFPVSIGGSSKNSTGMTQITALKENKITHEFNELNKKFGLEFKPTFYKITFSETSLVDDAIRYAFNKFLPQNDEFIVDYKALIVNLVNDVKQCCEYYYEEAEVVFKEILEYIYETVKDKFSEEITLFFKNEVLKKLKPLKKYDFDKRFLPHFDKDYLILDGNKFKVADIYGAAEISDMVLNFDERVNEYKGKLKKVTRCMNEISKYKNIGICGANFHGKIFAKLLNNIGDVGEHNIYFFDSDKNKWGTKIEEYTINNTELIKKMNIDKVVICSYTYQEEIYETLKELIDDSKIMKLYESDEEFYFDILV